jgi:hypothetical protein
MTVFDRAGLLRLFWRLSGRTLVGAVDGGDCVELVFDPNETGNLVTIFTDGRRRGLVAFGGVCREMVDQGYGRPPNRETSVCVRCRGTGEFGHLGVCFRCNGSGLA